MSWDVSLKRHGLPVSVERHEEGGTYRVGGTTEAVLNVTYNYSRQYRPLNGDRSLQEWLGGRRASECADDLRSAVAELGTERSDNYWDATPGNAGYALSILLRWAEDNPDATFEVW